MEFKRKKKRGVNQKVKRIWLSHEGYRITWRKEAFGVSVPARYQACVRTIVSGDFEDGRREMWNFVSAKRLHKSMKTAVADCERHCRLWSRVVRCSGIRAVREIFGREPTSVPKWASTKMNRRVFEMLIDSSPHHKYKNKEESTLESEPTKKPETKSKRKQRSDKGKKRGPRKKRN